MTTPRVIVPYVALHPITRFVLDSYGLPVEYVAMTDDDAYRRLLARIWADAEPVVLVEQDIAPWPQAIEELWGCPCDWGAYSYRLHGGIGIFHGFGCTKLTPRLMRALPDVWNEPGRWDVLDQRLFFAARDRELEPHHHRPAVIHLSERHSA